MSFVDGLVTIAKGAAAGVAVGVALPVFGTVGTITATGMVVTSLVGGALGAADAINEENE